MKGIRFLCLAIILIMALMLPAVVYAAKPEAKPNATNVEIVKKVGVRGVPLPRGGGGPTGTPAATGILGEGVSGTRYAIIVGISDYAVDEYDLLYADKDAEALSDTLTNVYGFNSENIQLLVDSGASRDAILEAIKGIKDVGANDEVVFFFSGHGARGRVDDGDREAIDEGIVPHECTPEAVIWDGELRQAFSGFDTDRIVFIFDSCLAGGMTDLEADGRIICMASTKNGYAIEVGTAIIDGEEIEINQGLFTYFFVKLGMMYGLADFYPDDDYVTVEEAFDFAMESLIELSKTTPILRQIPQIKDGFDEDLLL